MVRLLGRRARNQWAMLAALLAIVITGATIVGTCALLLSRTAEKAMEAAASRAAPEDIDVTAYIGTVHGPNVGSVTRDTRDLLTSALAPFPTSTVVHAWTVMRPLTNLDRSAAEATAYLYGAEDLSARAQLVTGRWPRGGGAQAGLLEAAVLESTARVLDLSVGKVVHLGAESIPEAAKPVDVIIVGILRAKGGTGWDRDTLAGAGFDVAYQDGGFAPPSHAYGPFLVDFADLRASGSTIDRLEITAHPALVAPGRRDLDTVIDALAGANSRLGLLLGDRVHIERVASRLPLTLQTGRTEQRVTATVVLAVALLLSILTMIALALASRLAAGARADETVLLSAVGISRGQFASAACVEAGGIAVLATGVAIPASSALHSGLTHLAPLAGAGLAAGPSVTATQVLAVVGFAVALAAGLVVLSVRPALAANDRRHRNELLARARGDVLLGLLVVFAAVGWWQLRVQSSGASSRADTVRVLAPALLIMAAAALALRLMRPALQFADRLGRRARGLVFPLAAFEAARRTQAIAVGLLIGLACATGTFGIAFGATWERSQHDQVDLLVGTDLAITLSTAPIAGQGSAIGAATGGEVSPATDRGVAVGQWLGNDGTPPRLIAVDTTRGEDLLRGRLDGGRTWAGVTRALSPPTSVGGIAVPVGVTSTLIGTASGKTRLTVTPRLVLQDSSGLRTVCTAEPVALDGVAHPLSSCATDQAQRLVAVSLPLQPDLNVLDGGGPSHLAVTLSVPVNADSDGQTWTAAPAQPAGDLIADATATLVRTTAATQLTVTATAKVFGPYGPAPELVATAFPAPGPLAAAVSSRFADGLGAHTGSRFTLTVGRTPVPIVVSAIVPEIPSAPDVPAVLMDLDALSRALLASGNLESPVDAWWVGDPKRIDAVERVTSLHLGPVVTRSGEAAELSGGPVRVGLPAVLRLLVPAAALLLLVGLILHVTSDLQTRALEVARLRGLGMYRREIRTVLLSQHLGMLFPLLVLGSAVGALATLVIAPLLVRSKTGAAAVPAPAPQWPWAAEAAFLTLLTVGCALAVATVVVIQTRRADAAHLRMAS